ncbi:MAG: AMP-binding protein [Elusimicrobia bacterium]|nr:AMP-binding protein [Elusimicrobiota bacterium]
MTTAVRPDVATRFLETAARLGDRPALVRGEETATFAALARDVELLAAGFRRAGVRPGDRAALLVPPGRDFFACTFALFRAGAVPVLIDPGIGFRNMGRCLAEAEPAAFIGSPKAHAARWLGRWAPSASLSVVADGRVPGLRDTRELRDFGARAPFEAAVPAPDAPAAVLFTSGSTGAPKGALYTHGIFAAQVDMLREMFAIAEGEVSVPTFPLFALFDVALGMTAVIPDMDFTRPGSVDPAMIVSLLQRRRAHQLFGSPALIDRVGRFGERHGVALPHLRRVMSAGAPVPAKTLARFSTMLAAGVQVFTPYGATEALPVALTGSAEVLSETGALTARGKGVCVGRPVKGMEVAVIGISDDAIPSWDDSLRVKEGQTGEIVVKGPVVTKEYFRRPEATALAKIADGGEVRHRMGDLGYFDDKGRLWFCGRKSHRVKTASGELYTIPVEGIFNAVEGVKRTALVGVRGEAVLCVEPEPGTNAERLRETLQEIGKRSPPAHNVKKFLFHPSFPVDIRHNAKIFREKLAVWAEGELR